MPHGHANEPDPIHYQSTKEFNDSQSDLELQSITPSSTKSKSGFASPNLPKEDEASDYHYLIRDRVVAHGARWRPGFWAQFPILGVLSLIGVLASISTPRILRPSTSDKSTGTIAGMVILFRSHESPLNDWGYGIAPSVYLAMVSVISNALTAYALVKGLEITFWRNALRGRTVCVSTRVLDQSADSTSCLNSTRIGSVGKTSVMP